MTTVTEERKLYRVDLAELAGIKVRSLARAKVAVPPRDGTDIEAGHARPFWWESTAQAWAAELAARPGQGWRAGLKDYGPEKRT